MEIGTKDPENLLNINYLIKIAWLGSSVLLEGIWGKNQIDMMDEYNTKTGVCYRNQICLK